jgi:DNA-binding beta-propeller fold protein YncE
VQITGAPGAVNGGATVDGSSTPLNASRWLQKIFLPSAHAGVALIDSATAHPDGSFSLMVQAKVGDIIEVTQTVDGQISPPTAILVTGDTVNLGFNGQDLEVDEFTGLVYTSAADDSGKIFRLDFLGGDPASEPEPFCDGLDNGVTSLALDAPQAMGYVISPSANALHAFGLVGNCDPSTITLPGTPLDITANPVSNGVVVSLEAPGGAASIMSVSDMGTSTSCDITIIHPGQVSHVATTLLATGPSPFVFAVSEFADGSIWVTRLDVTPPCKSPVTAGIQLPAGAVPGGIAAVNSNITLVSDAALHQVYQLDFTTQSVAAQLSVGEIPQGIAVAPRINRAYVVNLGDNSISIINLNNFSLRFSIPSVGLMPNDIELIPESGSAAVLSTFDDAVVFTDITF